MLSAYLNPTEGSVNVSLMVCRLALALVCGLTLASPSLADDPPGPAPIGGHTPPFVWTVPDLPQPRWKVVAGASTTRGAWPTDRVYYARTLADTERWSANVSKKDQAVARNLNYSRYGLLALFVTSRDYFTIAGVYWHGNGFLRVQVRTPDPYAECRGATFPPPSVCVMPRPPALSFPQYRLIAIRKDSLPSSVKRLYIAVVADPSPIVITTHHPRRPPRRK